MSKEKSHICDTSTYKLNNTFMKLFFQAFILMGLSHFSYGQVTISGNIADQNNNPLIGVEIYIQKLHVGTTSNLDGNYTLTKLPHGTIQIIFSYYGFETVSKKLDIHENISNLNIELKSSIFNIDEIIVSTPFNRLQSENVMKVEQATIAEMKKLGATSLVNGLESITGVSQISTGTSIGKPVIRGLTGNRVLIYVQGVRLENQQFGDEHGLGLSQAGLESVEVIKGPASLLYGSDALGGVIYFNPEKFAMTDKLSSDFNQQYSSNTNGTNTSFGIKQSKNQWKYLIRGSYNSHQDYKIPHSESVMNSRYNESSFNTGIGFSNQLLTSELRYNYTISNIGISEGVSKQSNSRNLKLPKQEIYNHIVSLHNHIHFDTSKLDINLGYIHNDRNEFEEEHSLIDPALRMKLNTLSYDIKYHFPKINRIELISGIQGLHQSNKNLGEELLIPDATIKDFGLFSTANIDFEKSSLLAGLRFDTRRISSEYHEVQHEDEIHIFDPINKYYTSFTASLGYKFNILSNIISRINLASGFRAPNLAELTSNGVHHGTNRFETGNSNLSNEQNFQTDIALEYKSEHIEFFANGFYNSLNAYIYLNPAGGIEDKAPVYEYTQENAKLYGGEFGFHLHPHPLDWMHIESSFELVIGKQNNGNYLPLIPANNWNNTIRAEFNIKNWLQNGFSTVNIGSWFDQNNNSEFETKTSGYSLLNLGIGGQFRLSQRKFELSMNLNNALNKEYISHLSRLKVYDISNIGRNLVINLSFKL